MSFAGVAEARVQKIDICYDFNCKIRQQVELSTEEWRSVIGWFYRQRLLPPKKGSSSGKRLAGWRSSSAGTPNPS